MALFRVLLIMSCLLVAQTAAAVDPAFAVRRSAMTMKRGRGSFQKEIGGSNDTGKQPKPMIGSPATSNKQWVPVAGVKSVGDLPQQEGKVQLIDTMAQALINGATNPTGAVSVVKYGSNTYCFSSSCPSCKIPLAKAKILEPNDETNGAPRICCDFCSSTYNLKNGAKIAKAESSGLLGGIVSGLMSAQESVPLPVYELGERKGKVVINLS
jgi:nitrite reductase/ring-hydroxylating ferredoxin subunit